MTDRRQAVNRLAWHHFDATGCGHTGPCCSHAVTEDGCCYDKRNDARPLYTNDRATVRWNGTHQIEQETP